jgi:hypothetical protein
MMLLDAALEDLCALKPREQFSYLAIAKKHGIVQLTLTQ